MSTVGGTNKEKEAKAETEVVPMSCEEKKELSLEEAAKAKAKAILASQSWQEKLELCKREQESLRKDVQELGAWVTI